MRLEKDNTKHNMIVDKLKDIYVPVSAYVLHINVTI